MEKLRGSIAGAVQAAPFAAAVHVVVARFRTEVWASSRQQRSSSQNVPEVREKQE